MCAGDTEKVMVRFHHTLQKNVFMVYRTKAYLAGEWTGDTDAIEKNQWNSRDKWSLHFVDAHANKQCYGTSKTMHP